MFLCIFCKILFLKLRLCLSIIHTTTIMSRKDLQGSANFYDLLDQSAMDLNSLLGHGNWSVFSSEPKDALCGTTKVSPEETSYANGKVSYGHERPHVKLNKFRMDVNRSHFDMEMSPVDRDAQAFLVAF